MSLLTKVKPKPQSYPLDAFVAPGHYFFCRRIALPEDLDEGEREEFAFIELEKLSPFPLEHLFYGCCFDAAQRHALVYAVYKRRLEPRKTADWLKLDAAVPDFLVALGGKAKAATPLVLVTERSLVGLRFDEASELPCELWAEELPLSDESSGEAAAIAAFARRCEQRFQAGPARLWRAVPGGLWQAGQARFAATSDSKQERIEEIFTRAALWSADLRDPETLELAKVEEKRNGVLWTGVLAMLALLGLLVLGEAAWGISKGYLAFRNSVIEQRAKPVAAVDSKQKSVNELLSFRESNLMPFQMLIELDAYRLQEGVPDFQQIVYRKAATDGPDRLKIEAVAQNRTQVTLFKRRLEGFSKVRAAELSSVKTGNEGVTFTVSVDFVPGAFLASMGGAQ